MTLAAVANGGDVSTLLLIAAISSLIVLVLAGIMAAISATGTRYFNTSRDVRPVTWAVTLATLTLFGLVAIPFIVLPNGVWIEIELIAIGLLIVGAFFGFLFGLPTVTRPPSAGTAETLLSVNTHLEDVTAKIATLLTGVALAQLIAIPHYILAFNTELRQILGASSGALGIALLLYFPPLGFMISYVVMRIQVSELFARADERLQRFVVGQPQIWRAPPLPDISDGATADQIAAARSIAQIPFASLTDSDQKATWARANALLGNFAAAEQAYQDVRVLNPRDYRALIDYATVIYNDPQIDDIPQVLSLLDQAEKICPPTNLDALSRLKVLRAAAYLYESGGYEKAILEVNSVIATANMPQPKLTRYYRACGFGQLFWALQTRGGPSQGAATAIAQIILNDSALTLAQGQVGRAQLLLVTSGEGRTNPADNDLQAFAVANAEFRKQLQIAPPSPPDPPAPPAPETITDAAITANWIPTNCLP